MHRGRRGVVASGHTAVCDAAAEILLCGGNAFDAAVAAGFAACVAETALTSLGGGGFLLARLSDGRSTLFDFFVDTPGLEREASALEPHFIPITITFPGSRQVFNVGRGSVAVPGTLAGLLHVHEQLGRLPLADILAPAVRLGREGVEINHHQGYFLELLRPIVTQTPEGRALYAPNGALLTEGDRFRNPDFATFIEALPRGAARELYEGDLARRIASDMRDGQGLLGARDLARYRVIERPPLEVDYRGHRLLTNPGPSFGGSLLAVSLILHERCVPEPGTDPDDAAGLLALAGVMQEVEALREDGRLTPDALPASERDAIAYRIRSFSRGTTHISVCDTEGNAASMTTTNGEGSGYIAPGTGIMLNNMMGEDDLHPGGFHSSPPAQRVSSMMSPCILLRDAEVHLVLGSGGSKRIRSALLQVIRQFIDFGVPIRSAVEHPRLHWDGERLQAEPGLPASSLSALARARPLNEWDRLDVYFGGVHAVVPGLEGAGDPRRGGCARTVEP